jgi:hypothetical protein
MRVKPRNISTKSDFPNRFIPVYIYNIHTVFVFCGFHSQDLSFPLPPTALGKLLEASSASAEIRIVLMAGCSQQLANHPE